MCPCNCSLFDFCSFLFFCSGTWKWLSDRRWIDVSRSRLISMIEKKKQKNPTTSQLHKWKNKINRGYAHAECFCFTYFLPLLKFYKGSLKMWATLHNACGKNIRTKTFYLTWINSIAESSLSLIKLFLQRAHDFSKEIKRLLSSFRTIEISVCNSLPCCKHSLVPSLNFLPVSI